MILRPPRSTRTDTLFPYTTLFRSRHPTARCASRPGALRDIQFSWSLPYSSVKKWGAQGPPSSCHFQRFVRRSEEHTSELQSLMRISYAVFCLKKQKKTYHKLAIQESNIYCYMNSNNQSTTNT